jgi:hypothetical protein
MNNVSNKKVLLPRTKPRTYEPNSDSDYEVSITLNNTVLYNAMIHPFTRMVIKGAIWYQGKLQILLMHIIHYDFR